MNFKKIIILTLTVSLLLSTIVGCRKINGDVSSGNTSYTTSTIYGIVDVVGNDSSDLQPTDDTISDNEGDSNTIYTDGDIPTYIEYEQDNDEGSTGSGSDGGTGGISSGTTGGSTSTDGGGTGNVDSSQETKPTYSTSPNYLGKIKTVSIDSGKSVKYVINFIADKFFTINSPNAYVIYNGVTYEAKNGVVSFFVDAVSTDVSKYSFEIGNKGSSAESFTIRFVGPKGSRDNPEVIESVNDKFIVSIEEGNEYGYFYKYIASQAGKIKFYILSDTNSGKLSISRIIDPTSLAVQQRDTTETAEDYVKSDEIGTYVEFDVKKGDELSIIASPNSNPGVYPAVTIEWKIVYS